MRRGIKVRGSQSEPIPTVVPFSTQETLRYSRQLGLAGFGPSAQERLRAASVLVVGAGGLGCPALLYLAAAGVGKLVVIDPDTVDVSNLQRQVLYTTADAGRPKALAAAERLRALNPHILIEPHVARLDRNNALALVAAVDLVLDGSDNFAARYLVNDACALAGRPFVYGAIQGFEGQVSVFNHGGGPDYRDLFPSPPPPGAAPNCAEAGVLGVLPGLVGTLQATEVLKLLAGIGEPLSGKLLLIDALTHSTHVLRLARRADRTPITELPPENYGGAACASAAADEIAPDALRAALAGPEAERPQLLDVREDHERAAGAILPSVHLPLARLGDHCPAALDPTRPLVVYCAGGIRSARALPLLRERHGFCHARSLRGGFQAWLAGDAAP
jgi:sulfur-carrier protein adenylyltransferase/sulfurtransferase